MSDLVAFLRARLDEERALADLAAANVRDNPFWGNDWAQGMTGGMGGPGGDLGAVFSPDRVMADVQAKRAILDLLELTADALPRETLQPEYAQGYVNALRWTSLHLAAPYADHPDYDERWRP